MSAITGSGGCAIYAILIDGRAAVFESDVLRNVMADLSGATHKSNTEQRPPFLVSYNLGSFPRDFIYLGLKNAMV